MKKQQLKIELNQSVKELNINNEEWKRKNIVVVIDYEEGAKNDDSNRRRWKW